MAYRCLPTLALALLLSVVARMVSAHELAGNTLQPTWTFDPWIATPICVAGVLYARGFLAVWRRAGRGRRVMLRRSICFWSGWLALAGALISPLHWLGEHLFFAHMIEHEILMTIAAPMIVLARPVGVLLWGLPASLRRSTGRLMRANAIQITWRRLSAGLNATVLHGVVVWAWHAPVVFDAAVTNVILHRVQHFSFFFTAVLFWWAMCWRSNYGVAAWHLIVTMLHTSALGALMALAPKALYLTQTRVTQAWHLSPLEDQQLAGMIMWVPAGTVYAGAALAMVALWISVSGRRSDHVQPLRL
ncbi:cytochrome c oxidase assembly protein [Rhizobium mesoamericanum]|uniref:cytochrome c oxidase assembly protein n=1 Tax=Rhizobium mesoamericanum TaxID=1079800 RepID=UPI00042A5E5E|nr:cytochrome c oxidase assembly protein [Rhizobium mesoamericanum]